MDSGASHHMTGSKEMLSELKPPPQDVTITYGYGSKSDVLGLGKVVVTPDVSIVDIMLVKTLSYNLLSVLQLANMGFESYFTKLTVVLLWEKTPLPLLDMLSTVCMWWTSLRRNPLLPQLV